jgi:hypothetical protein
VVGDAYAGETFRCDFEAYGIRYERSKLTASELYEALEPRLNAGEVELPDLPVLQEQLLTLVRRGARITHEAGGHDDYANAAAGAVYAAAAPSGYDHTMRWLYGDDATQDANAPVSDYARGRELMYKELAAHYHVTRAGLWRQ